MFDIKSYNDCDIITLEPGDRTKYQFIVINKDDDYLIISGMNNTRFSGYAFPKDSIREFFKTNGEPPDPDKYHKWASDLLHKKNDYLSYAVYRAGGKALCNPFTALAALYAGHMFLTAGELP